MQYTAKIVAAEQAPVPFSSIAVGGWFLDSLQRKWMKIQLIKADPFKGPRQLFEFVEDYAGVWIRVIGKEMVAERMDRDGCATSLLPDRMVRLLNGKLEVTRGE